MGNILDTAIITAVKAHSGQLDKGSEPYILHPLRVMANVSGYDAKVVAVLHDVVEDSDVTIEQIAQIFPHDIVCAIIAITKKKDESYFAYIERVKKNGLATTVKIADLEDNLKIERIKNPTKDDILRLTKYSFAKDVLTGNTDMVVKSMSGGR